ncbi:DNA primase, partial [Streptomyces sp. NPDC056689]
GGYGKERGGDHGKPSGGLHTGGGALSMVNDDDWTKDKEKYDPESYKKDGEGSGKDSWGSDSDYGKPRGGMHTGGGGLATTPGVTAGGIAILGVAAAGAFAMRRKRASEAS